MRAIGQNERTPARRRLCALHRSHGTSPAASLVAAVAVLLLAGFLGCGRKAPPRPPQDVQPDPISDLTAGNVPDGIQLSWSRPLTYADRSRMTDLAGFVIERAAGTQAGAVFARLSTLEVTDRDRFRQVKRFQYVDRDVAPETTYRYRVVSFTLDRYFSEPSNVVTAERTVPHEEKHAPLSATQW